MRSPLEHDAYFLLILSQMALDEVETFTIQFFRAVYPSLSNGRVLMRKQMSELAVMSSQAAGRHLKRLHDGGYLTRRHRTAWALSDITLKNMTLRKLSRCATPD